MGRAERKTNRYSERKKRKGNISRAGMCNRSGVFPTYLRDEFKLRRTNSCAIYLTDFSHYIFSASRSSLHKLSSATVVTLKALSPRHMSVDISTCMKCCVYLYKIPRYEVEPWRSLQ